LNARQSPLLDADIGLAQLERIDEMVEAKRRIFSWYEEGLDGVPHIRSINRERPWARSIYWMSSIELSEDSPTPPAMAMLIPIFPAATAPWNANMIGLNN